MFSSMTEKIRRLLRQNKMIVKVIFHRYNKGHEKEDPSRFHFDPFGQAEIPGKHRFRGKGDEEHGSEPVNRGQWLFPAPCQRV